VHVHRTLLLGDVLSFVGYGRGADSHIFPPSDPMDVEGGGGEGGGARAEGGGGGGAAAAAAVAVEDAVPLVRHLPLRPLGGSAAAAAGGETSQMTASL
jgi:hypothetical protein